MPEGRAMDAIKVEAPAKVFDGFTAVDAVAF